MPTNVACSVSNCSFWNEGNRCGAQDIAIEIDSHSKKRWDEEFAAEFGSHHDVAPASSVTCCLTFKPNGKDS